MKFIVDAQLPRKLAVYLNNKRFDTIHTLDLPDKNRTTDIQIIEFADLEKRIVITKDYDFYESKLIKNVPEKLLFVLTGNISNFMLINIFDKYVNKLQEFFKENQIIELYKDSIRVRV